MLEPIGALFTGGMEALVESATGWYGMGIIFVYSFLIAFVLPGPSEIVLLAPLDLGLSPLGELSIIMLVSATRKAVGSVFAFHIGQEAKQAGPIVRWLRASRWDVLEWSEKRLIRCPAGTATAGWRSRSRFRSSRTRSRSTPLPSSRRITRSSPSRRFSAVSGDSS